MAGKRSKPPKVAKKLNISHLEPNDVLCPVCRTILIEPVSLPCNHVFCKVCFEGSMENANLVCPLCRTRVGSWFRKAKKEGKVVDENLWNAVQDQYPKEVQNKYSGIDNIIEEAEKPVIIVANPGEIRREYELERKREEEEQRKIREAEEKASTALIQKLKDEEEYQRQVEEEKLRLDAELAKKLSLELKASSSKPIIQTPKSSKKGPMDKFVHSTKKSNKTFLSNLRHNAAEGSHNMGTVRKPEIVPRPKTPFERGFSKKEYTSQVLNLEKSPDPDPFSFLNQTLHSPPVTLQKKSYDGSYTTSHKSGEERKTGYRSSPSGKSDVIDQECKFYFKPIDPQKKHHIKTKVPLQIPLFHNLVIEEKNIVSPSGKTTNLLDSPLSAFARFLKVVEEIQKNTHTNLNQNVIEDENSTSLQVGENGSPKPLKRKITDKSGPVNKRGKLFNTQKSLHKISSSLFDFKVSQVSSPMFSGFKDCDMVESNRVSNNILNTVATFGSNLSSVRRNTNTFGNGKTELSESFVLKNSLINKNTSMDSTKALKLTIPKRNNRLSRAEEIKNKLNELLGTKPSEIKNSTSKKHVNETNSFSVSSTSVESKDTHPISVNKSLSNESNLELRNRFNQESLEISVKDVEQCSSNVPESKILPINGTDNTDDKKNTSDIGFLDTDDSDSFDDLKNTIGAILEAIDKPEDISSQKSKSGKLNPRTNLMKTLCKNVVSDVGLKELSANKPAGKSDPKMTRKTLDVADSNSKTNNIIQRLRTSPRKSKFDDSISSFSSESKSLEQVSTGTEGSIDSSPKSSRTSSKGINRSRILNKLNDALETSTASDEQFEVKKSFQLKNQKNSSVKTYNNSITIPRKLRLFGPKIVERNSLPLVTKGFVPKNADLKIRHSPRKAKSSEYLTLDTISLSSSTSTDTATKAKNSPKKNKETSESEESDHLPITTASFYNNPRTKRSPRKGKTATFEHLPSSTTLDAKPKSQNNPKASTKTKHSPKKRKSIDESYVDLNSVIGSQQSDSLLNFKNSPSKGKVQVPEFKDNTSVDASLTNKNSPKKSKFLDDTTTVNLTSEVFNSGTITKSKAQFKCKSSPKKCKNEVSEVMEEFTKSNTTAESKSSPKKHKVSDNHKVALTSVIMDPSTSKNSPKRSKLGQKKLKISVERFAEVYFTPEEIEKRKLQEEKDFELAKKLQEQFDLIHVSSTTRRGTKRQITLDEMLSV